MSLTPSTQSVLPPSPAVSPQVKPSFFSSSRNKIIFVILITAILVIIGSLVFLEVALEQKPPPISTTPTQTKIIRPGVFLTSEGTVTEINQSYLVVKEDNGQLIKISIQPPLEATIQNMKIQSSKASKNPADVTISQVLSSSKIDYQKIKVGDWVKVVLEQNNNQYSAKTITLYTLNQNE